MDNEGVGDDELVSMNSFAKKWFLIQIPWTWSALL